MDRATSGLPLRRWVPLAVMAGLFAAVVAAANLSDTEITRLPESDREIPTPPPPDTMPAGAEPPPPTFAPETGSGLPSWLSTVLTVVCVALVVGVVALLLWFWLRDRLIHRRPGSLLAEVAADPLLVNQEEVRAAVEEGLADLEDSETDPRRAVIACWVRLEQAAAAAGTPRLPGDTSAELVTRLLAAHRVSGSVLAGLAAVYREARYATHTVDVAMRDQARAALRQLRDELSTVERT